MENALIKYSFKAATTIKSAINEADIPTLIVDHPVIYFGATFAVAYLIARKSGLIDEIWWWQWGDYYTQLKIDALAESHALKPWKWHWGRTKAPEPLKLDHINENPFRNPINYSDFPAEYPRVFQNNPAEFELIYVDENWSTLVDTTVDRVCTFMLHPEANKIFTLPADSLIAPSIVEIMCNLDILMNKCVRPWTFYGETIKEGVKEARRPMIEMLYFYSDYIYPFMRRIPVPGSESYFLLVNKYNFSKFMDMYYGLGIDRYKVPYAKQWLTEYWDDACYEKFLLFRKAYRSSFKAFTGRYCDTWIIKPENADILKIHQTAFKNMWLDIAFSVPPEVLAADLTFVDRMITYGHYAKYLTIVS